MTPVRVALLCLLSGACLGPPVPAAGVDRSAPAEPKRRPNLLLILADDLGYGKLGCYGQARIQTPNIDRLAAGGLRFSAAYSGSPVCAPSRSVLLTGLHTGHTFVRDNQELGGWGEHDPEGQLPLPAGTPTLARAFQAAGYATGCFGKWGLGGPESSGVPNAQGFDRFYGILCQRRAHNHYPPYLWSDAEQDPLPGNAWFSAHQRLEAPLEHEADYRTRFAGQTYAPDRILEEALEFLRAERDKPWFLYYPSPLPHVALQAPAEWVDRYPRSFDSKPYLGQQGYLPNPRPKATYAAMISHLDHEVGVLLHELEALGQLENTLVIVTSDNGPTWVGGIQVDDFDSAGGLRGRKATAYEGGIRVPLVAAWPGHVPVGVCDQPVAFQDLFPTCVELFGLEAPPASDGVSIAPCLQSGGLLPTRPPLYFEFAAARQRSVRVGNWKLIESQLGQPEPTVELFDLEHDPGESEDLAAVDPERTAVLFKILASEHSPSAEFPLPGVDS